MTHGDKEAIIQAFNELTESLRQALERIYLKKWEELVREVSNEVGLSEEGYIQDWVKAGQEYASRYAREELILVWEKLQETYAESEDDPT